MLDSAVSGHCLSACANYVFPAGAQKQLEEDALVVFHGGFHQQNLVSKLLDSHETQMRGDTYVDDNSRKEASPMSSSDLETDLQRKYFPDHGACAKPNTGKDALIESAKRCMAFRQDAETEFYTLISATLTCLIMVKKRHTTHLNKRKTLSGFTMTCRLLLKWAY